MSKFDDVRMATSIEPVWAKIERDGSLTVLCEVRDDSGNVSMETFEFVRSEDSDGE